MNHLVAFFTGIFLSLSHFFSPPLALPPDPVPSLTPSPTFVVSPAPSVVPQTSSTPVSSVVRTISSNSVYLLANKNGPSPYSAGMVHVGIKYQASTKTIFLNLAGSVNGLRPEKEYDVVVDTPQGKLYLTGFASGQYGSNSFSANFKANNLGLCDFRSLVLQQKASEIMEMSATDLNLTCPAL